MKCAKLMLMIVVASGTLMVRAADVDSPAPPTSALSAMFSLEDIYNRLSAGTLGAKRTGAFIDPTTGPVATRHTLNDVMGVAPGSDNANGAAASQVLFGKTYWSLLNNAWGPTTGTMPNNGGVMITPGTVNQPIALGFHDGTGKVSGDVNLNAANIKSGVSIFGVAGSTSVVDTSLGTAVSGDLLSGKTAFVNGALVAGTMPNNGTVNITPGTTIQTIALGFHSGAGTVTGDANLLSTNIKSGASIFGVTGNANVVNTAEANSPAGAGDVLSGKKAYVNGALVTGTVPAGTNLTGSNGSLTVTITDGLYSGSKTATAADTNLVAGNIKLGTTVFGISGTVVSATGNATAADVVVGKTFSNATATGVAGTRAIEPMFKSGQTTSFAAGDDGATQKGLAPPSPRFIDNGNGTITDNLTGLIWVKNANAFSTQIWTNAVATCNNLTSGTAGLTDGSTAGQWRLPNVKELQSLIDYSNFSQALPSGHPFFGVQSLNYWTSTTYMASTTFAWAVNLDTGVLNGFGKTNGAYVWPVRGGQ